MTLPHREWTNFYTRTIERASSDNGENTASRWTTNHITTSKIGDATVGIAPAATYYSWKTIVRPSAADFELSASMDEVIDFGITLRAAMQVVGCVAVNFDIWWEPLDCPLPVYAWEHNTVTGRHYDGVNEWQGYPYYTGCYNGDNFAFTPAQYPMSAQRWIPSNVAPAVKYGNDSQDMLFQQGLVFYTDAGGYGGACGYPLPDNTELSGFVEPLHLVVNYLNPVLNSLSRNSMSAAGGIRLALTGLGFDQSDAELSSVARSTQNWPEAWASTVGTIEFIGQQGQGTTTLTSFAGDFTVVSDTRIVIDPMPPLAAGTYHIRLIKDAVATIGAVDGYFGDWSCNADGLASAGTRRSFLVADIVDPPRPPIVTFKWPWIINNLHVDKFYAPIDIRSPEIFWEGRVLGLSTLKRSIDSMTGMFNISDMNVDLASNDMEFQMLLATGHCKNQVVEITHGWATEPAGWQQHMFHGIVDDYTPHGPTFKAMLKDVSRRHFRKTMPRFTVTTDMYPNAHENAVGIGIPDPVGLHSLTVGSAPGSIEALCTDTALFKYVAAGAPIGITAVYSAAALVNPANYAITYEDGGRTYITFTTDQGDSKITFNCTGYSLPAWDSANGYVQNPAYVLGFYLIYILQVPINFVDLVSLDVVAQQFVDGGWDEIGRLALTESKTADAYLQELLFSFGIKMWPDMRGRFTFGRKDVSNFATDLLIFAQIHTQDSPARPYDLRGAVNYAKSRWDYHPAASLWKDSQEQAHQASIDTLFNGERQEAEWDYPWITSADFAAVRRGEDLTRLAYGHRTVSFKLPIEFIGVIDIFDNFRLQDPFDIHPTGAGNAGHYYYITSLDYDFQNQLIGVVAEDLQWLMGSCMIIGKYTELVRDYNAASPWQQTFAYIGRCAEGTFLNGDPNKKICSCS